MKKIISLLIVTIIIWAAIFIANKGINDVALKTATFVFLAQLWGYSSYLIVRKNQTL